MIVKLLTEHHLEFLSLKGGYRGTSVFTHVKMPHHMVDVLKFRILVACQKGIDRQCRPRSELRKQSDQGLLCLLFDKNFVNSSSNNQHLRTERKVF